MHTFDFLFPALQESDDNFLPDSGDTPVALAKLGRQMRDLGDARDPGVAQVPAAYTYFGQFVAHDVTFERPSTALPHLLATNLRPCKPSVLRGFIRNARTPTLDLDSLYDSPAPRNGDQMVVGAVSALDRRVFPQRKPFLRPHDRRRRGDNRHDVPRTGPSAHPARDRIPLIGDERNDENLLLSQLHVALLRAHNALVATGSDFAEARSILTQHYQHVIIRDFLPRIADRSIVSRILRDGNRIFTPSPASLYMPFEYAGAVFRFGHSMVREVYDINCNFNLSAGTEVKSRPAPLEYLFMRRILDGWMPGVGTRRTFHSLPENWIVEWHHVVNSKRGIPYNQARRLDTKLVEPGLFRLVDVRGKPHRGDGARLAVRNLLRGYFLRIPTGQAVARALGQVPLTPVEIEGAAMSPAQGATLRETGLSSRTPLWYYILAEARHGGGNCLGNVGSILCAEVLVGLLRCTPGSIWNDSTWNGPTLPSRISGRFGLADLLSCGDICM